MLKILYSVHLQDFEFVKVCVVELGYNHTFCHDLNNHTDIEVRLSVKS